MDAALNDPRPGRRTRVGIVDMAVSADSPAGSCVLAEVQGLVDAFDVTVFSNWFEPASAPGVEFVRVPAMARPVLLRYLSFHLAVPFAMAGWRLRGRRADCLQATQGQWPGAAICYAHFCHRSYLRHQWPLSTVRGLRRASRWAVHRFNAACESAAIRRARIVVVPSRGLAREIELAYPEVAGKLRVLANPVDIDHFARPPAFDRARQRAGHGFLAHHVVLVFVALGDFERKGLGLLLDAVAELDEAGRDAVRLLVVGGNAGEVAGFASHAHDGGIGDAVRFTGLQRDVRPSLWAGDVFAFPSIYETFGLAAAQAAAAGLPVMACEGVHGLSDFVLPGQGGWLLPRTREAIGEWLRDVLAVRETLPAMGRVAAQAVRPYAPAEFQARWREALADVVRDHVPQAA